MKQIIIVKPGSFDRRDRKLLNESGIVLVEHENPEEVRIVNMLDGLDGFDGTAIVSSMVRAIMNNESARDLFGAYMIRNLSKHLDDKK